MSLRRCCNPCNLKNHAKFASKSVRTVTSTLREKCKSIPLGKYICDSCWKRIIAEQRDRETMDCEIMRKTPDSTGTGLELGPYGLQQVISRTRPEETLSECAPVSSISRDIESKEATNATNQRLPAFEESPSRLRATAENLKGRDEMDRLGLYQIVVFLIISIPVALSGEFVLDYVFTAANVDYRCLVPECEDASNATWISSHTDYSIPYLDGHLEKCTRYVIGNASDICSESSFTNETQSCDSWVYDPEKITIQNEFDLTCADNQWKITLVGSMNNFGHFVGLVFAGIVSDRYGRRTVVMWTTFLSGISGVIHSFSLNYWMFLFFEFLDNAFAAGVYGGGFILGLELVGSKQRVLGSTIFACMFTVGEIILGLQAMWLDSWRTLLRVIYIPAIFAILLPLGVPESVRWLLAHDKADEAEQVFRRMLRVNGIEVTDDAIQLFKKTYSEKFEKKDEEETTKAKTPYKQILKSPTILLRLITCSFCWLTTTFAFYGLSLNSVAFSGDNYTNFILVSAVEIPAYFLTWAMTDYVGRKPTLSSAFLLGGIFCLAIEFVPSDTWEYLPLMLYLGGKGCVTMAFGAIYIYTTEMFPTTLRHSLLGICGMSGAIGSMLAPQTPLLATIMESLPVIFFGSMSIIAGLLSLTFPETLGRDLPDTVYEAEHLGKVRMKSRSSRTSMS